MTSGAPMTLLRHVGGASLDRKRRLLGCGLGRHVWPALRDDRSRHAIDAAERYADGAAGEAELSSAEAGARAAMVNVRRYERNRNRYECFGTAVGAWVAGAEVRDWSVAPETVDTATDTPLWEDAAEAMRVRGGVWHAELGWFCAAVRCVFGNPFRPVAFNHRWRRKAVLSIARSIYDERAFDRLPSLAAALEEVGCDSTDVLSHLRTGGAHVKGCWALDLVLGRS